MTAFLSRDCAVVQTCIWTRALEVIQKELGTWLITPQVCKIHIRSLLYLMNILCHFLLTNLPCRTGSLNNLPMLVTWKEVKSSLYVINSYNVIPTGTSCVIHVLHTVPSRSTNQDNFVTSYLHDVHHGKTEPHTCSVQWRSSVSSQWACGLSE